MADEITNTVLLEHIQAMKNDLQSQIKDLSVKLLGLDGKFTGLDGKVTRLQEAMERGFEEARQHRQALQEDLYATMRIVSKHDKKLARL